MWFSRCVARRVANSRRASFCVGELQKSALQKSSLAEAVCHRHVVFFPVVPDFEGTMFATGLRLAAAPSVHGMRISLWISCISSQDCIHLGLMILNMDFLMVVRIAGNSLCCVGVEGFVVEQFGSSSLCCIIF